MGYDRTALRKAVNLSLNEDLVRRSRELTRSLSGTVEDLLDEFIAREVARRTAEDARVGRLLQAVDRFHVEHGLLSDEFSAL
jgi:antitoxin CcdA